MAVEFGGVHAFDKSQTVLVGPAMNHLERILEDISPLGQEIDKEMGGRILGGFVVPQSVRYL